MLILLGLKEESIRRTNWWVKLRSLRMLVLMFKWGKCRGKVKVRIICIHLLILLVSLNYMIQISNLFLISAIPTNSTIQISHIKNQSKENSTPNSQPHHQPPPEPPSYPTSTLVLPKQNPWSSQPPIPSHLSPCHSI